jgi:hypothetical protein
MLTDAETTATALLVIAADRLGLELLEWDPETVLMEVEQSFGVKLPPGNFNKLMAAIELLVSDSFYTSLPDFIRICNILYNGTFDPRAFDPADAGEIAWGLTEAILLWPPTEHPEKPFADKILQYIGHSVHDEGIMIPPDALRLGLPGDEELWDQVQANFSDDPEMFAAIYAVEKDKTDGINKLVKDKLRLLLTQLEPLTLQNGNTEQAVKKMLAALQREQTAGQEMQPATPAV